MWEIWAIYRIYLILPPGGIVGEKPPTVGELGIYIYIYLGFQRDIPLTTYYIRGVNGSIELMEALL